ncbi:MAG: 2-oxoglutarate dehydrogenase E1 component, partial [Planctomycetota bacterium]|nr:2-oxoglutarate dehydrogenase E1 component [Planctomycetota bacterium]
MSGSTTPPGSQLPGDGPAPSLNGWNAPYVEHLYEQWTTDPESVDRQWHPFFEGFQLGAERMPDPTSDEDAPTRPALGAGTGSRLQVRVDQLIERHRSLGHLAAHLNPLEPAPAPPAELELAAVGLDGIDLDTPVDPGTLPLGDDATLGAVIEHLRRSWCGRLGVELSHIRDLEQQQWLINRIEQLPLSPPLDGELRKRILRELVQATGLEQFLMRRYIGKKWFSLEGNETLIPMLNELVNIAATDSAEEIAFGMAHRGRINVLVNILQKSYEQLFTEFEESWAEDFIQGGGDVKYHRGFSSDIVSDTGHPVHLSMASNPSHLEWGHPVSLGRVRAKQRLRNDDARDRCIPVIMHGDASLPGQGIVQETFNLSELPGYTVGGSIHIVINNQIGFTTEPIDLFTGTYCSDIARAYDIPVFHVNGFDPELCVQVMLLAYEFRQRYQRDVLLDLYGYRKYGHNETDEPAFTQPVMYKAIAEMVPVAEQYADALLAEGVISSDEYESAKHTVQNLMDESQERIREQPVEPAPPAFDDQSAWAGFSETYDWAPIDTGVPRDQLARVADALGSVPEGFVPHRKLERLLLQRGSAIEQDEPLDWAMGELLAYGTLLMEGTNVRLTGEDVMRGTFSHRHAGLFHADHGENYSALNHIEESQAQICIHNSPVTEGGCIGFEYGYSLGDPNMLVIWEAQFGDFANAGQVFFDQFIASAARKWARYSGLTMLLPHGYEGQGPEHSSARLERFLQLSANDNMEIVNPTTPAQEFHLLR